MPYKTTVKKGEKPLGELVRRVDVLRWLGISNSAFYQAVNAGLLTAKRLFPGSRLYYQVEEVEQLFLTGFRTSKDTK
jgi:hypothetical protein